MPAVFLATTHRPKGNHHEDKGEGMKSGNSYARNERQRDERDGDRRKRHGSSTGGKGRMETLGQLERFSWSPTIHSTRRMPTGYCTWWTGF